MGAAADLLLQRGQAPRARDPLNPSVPGVAHIPIAHITTSRDGAGQSHSARPSVQGFLPFLQQGGPHRVWKQRSGQEGAANPALPEPEGQEQPSGHSPSTDTLKWYLLVTPSSSVASRR